MIYKELSSNIGVTKELSSKQEEADTKIFLWAKFAASLGFESASIITVDSDVAILSIYYQHRLDVKLFLRIGTGSKEKIFDIQTNDLSIDVVDALPAVHALSGCDSTSSFSGIGKVKFFKTVCKATWRKWHHKRYSGRNIRGIVLPCLWGNRWDSYKLC